MMEKDFVTIGLNALSIESDALVVAREAIDPKEFERAVIALAKAERIAAAGCGHSGIACQHFTHLMCCIERPARFISPAEAVHGAMGYLQKGDVILLVSRGGKTDELLPIGRIAKQRGATVIGVTENLQSPLAELSDIVLKMAVTRECDRYNCQGTTSFVVTGAIFDALQTALVEYTEFQNEEFAVIHPAGAVGKRLNQTEEG